MKKLWAPWRIDYILKAKEEGCFLCEIIRSEQDRKNLLVRRGGTCFVVLNRYPYNSGHLMVAPYRHVPSVRDLSDDEKLEMMNLVATSMETLTALMHPEGFNVGINEGESAGAGLREHVHTHIVPRWMGDTNFMPVLADTKVLPESLDQLWEKLHRSWPA